MKTIFQPLRKIKLSKHTFDTEEMECTKKIRVNQLNLRHLRALSQKNRVQGIRFSSHLKPVLTTTENLYFHS